MHKIDLLGDGIENEMNAVAMINATKMFSSDCLFLDKKDLAARFSKDLDAPRVVSQEDALTAYDVILALDNNPGAKSIYGYRVSERSRVVLIAGNERLGISKTLLAAASDLLVIPMVSRKVNCLNVASASAVALYYLSHRFPGGMPTKSHPQKRRPELLLIGGNDHVELGSSIRSACAFGWNRLFIEDRCGAWFGGDHAVKREARAAARRAKNEIRVVPTSETFKYKFERATVVTTDRSRGVPLHGAKLADGPGQLIVLADEATHDAAAENCDRFANRVDFAHIEIPAREFRQQFRLTASIAMAEVARQVGQKAPWRPAPQEPLYESALKVLADERGVVISLEDLLEY